MSGLICRKSMMPCHTPGMCAPHGGCQPDTGFEPQHIDLGKFVDWVYALKTERDQLKTENTDLHATLQAAKGEIERLKGECEALRKDNSEPCDGCFMAEAEALRKKAEVLRYFTGAAYPCSTEIDPRGYKWSEAYLDEALVSAREVMSKEANHD